MKTYYCTCGNLIEYRVKERIVWFLSTERYVCGKCLRYKNMFPSSIIWSKKLAIEGQRPGSGQLLKWEE